jgi:hypothetical protein
LQRPTEPAPSSGLAKSWHSACVALNEPLSVGARQRSSCSSAFSAVTWGAPQRLLRSARLRCCSSSRPVSSWPSPPTFARVPGSAPLSQSPEFVDPNAGTTTTDARVGRCETFVRPTSSCCACRMANDDVPMRQRFKRSDGWRVARDVSSTAECPSGRKSTESDGAARPV